VDGPSAGVAMAVAAVSAITGRPVKGDMAVTGEVSVLGEVKPVGGVPAKVEAAEQAGLSEVLIPAENKLERFEHTSIQVTPVRMLSEALERMLLPQSAVEDIPQQERTADRTGAIDVLAAEEQSASGKA